MIMDDDLSVLLANLCKAYRNQLDIALSQQGLYVGQEMILRALWAKDGQSQARLAARLRIEPPTVSKMVHRPARIGLVTQRAVAGDARARHVWLTERGCAIRPAVEAACQAVARQAFTGLTAAETAALVAAIQRMYRNLADQV